MQKCWYLERIDFLSMPMDTLAGIETEANDSGFLVLLVLVLLKSRCGLTLLSFTNGLILSWKFNHGSAIAPASPVGR